MYTCLCHGISESFLRRLIREVRLSSHEEVAEHSGAGTGCGCCRDEIAALLKEEAVQVIDLAAEAPQLLAQATAPLRRQVA